MENSYPMNPLRLRDSICRMFNGTAREIISELLQNCQRAGASKVLIEATRVSDDSYMISFKDNGKGINSIEDLEKLISLGDTGFDEAVINQQKPAGLGINSVLVNAGCFYVNILSKKYFLRINKDRWWNDLAYWKNWKSQVRELDESIPTHLNWELKKSDWNFNINFEVSAFLYNEITQELTNESYKLPITIGYSSYFTVDFKTNHLVDKNGISSNYLGYLKKLPTDLMEYKEPIKLYSREYRGGLIHIVRDKFHNMGSYVNWYGQLIKIKYVNYTNLYFYYECSEKTFTGLTPLNPTRQSFVEDDNYRNFIDAVLDTFLFMINDSYINTLYNNSSHLLNDVIKKSINIFNHFDREDLIKKIDYIRVRNCKTKQEEILRKDYVLNNSNIFLFKDNSILFLKDNFEEEMYCIFNSFIDSIKSEYSVYLHLDIIDLDDKYYKKLKWLAGDKLKTQYKNIPLEFRELGEIFIVPAERYFNNENNTIYTFKPEKFILIYDSLPTYDDIEECNIYLGVKNNSTSELIEGIKKCLPELYCSDLFNSDGSDYDNSYEYYETEVIKPIVRSLKGNFLKNNFTYEDLKYAIFSKTGIYRNSKIKNVLYNYDDSNRLISVTVHFEIIVIDADNIEKSKVEILTFNID